MVRNISLSTLNACHIQCLEIKHLYKATVSDISISLDPKERIHKADSNGKKPEQTPGESCSRVIILISDHGNCVCGYLYFLFSVY